MLRNDESQESKPELDGNMFNNIQLDRNLRPRYLNYIFLTQNMKIPLTFWCLLVFSGMFIVAMSLVTYVIFMHVQTVQCMKRCVYSLSSAFTTCL